MRRRIEKQLGRCRAGVEDSDDPMLTEDSGIGA
jgi:hypothetical protein